MLSILSRGLRDSGDNYLDARRTPGRRYWPREVAAREYTPTRHENRTTPNEHEQIQKRMSNPASDDFLQFGRLLDQADKKHDQKPVHAKEEDQGHDAQRQADRCSRGTGRCPLPEPTRVDLAEFIAACIDWLRNTIERVHQDIYAIGRLQKCGGARCARQDPDLHWGAGHPSRMSCSDLPRMSAIRYDLPLAPSKSVVRFREMHPSPPTTALITKRLFYVPLSGGHLAAHRDLRLNRVERRKSHQSDTGLAWARLISCSCAQADLTRRHSGQYATSTTDGMSLRPSDDTGSAAAWGNAFRLSFIYSAA
jgi:hypothetical protein